MHEAVNLQHASSARILSTSPSTRSSTCLALGVLHGDGLHSGSTAVRQWRQKRVLMRPEAAFPYVSAAEGAQHPSKSRHAQRPAAAKRTVATKEPPQRKHTPQRKEPPPRNHPPPRKNPSRRCVHHPRHQDGQKYLKESDYSA